jgi:hypothetical protein
MMARAKAFMDKHIERFISRKFMVWLTATGCLLHGQLTSSDWVAISLAYIGIQGLADIATQWKAGKKLETK